MNNVQKIDKIEKRILMRDMAYEKLKDAIKNGMFAPHSRLIEEKIALIIGTSRTPIREVFQRLEKDGLIYKRERGGYAVSEDIELNVKEFIELSVGLLGYAVFLAAVKMSDHAVKSLEDIIKLEEKSIESRDYNTFFVYNMKFYNMFCLFSKNTTLYKMSQRLTVENFKIDKASRALNESVNVRVNLHKKIILSIKNRDPYAAERYARRDMTISMKEYFLFANFPYKIAVN